MSRGNFTNTTDFYCFQIAKSAQFGVVYYTAVQFVGDFISKHNRKGFHIDTPLVSIVAVDFSGLIIDHIENINLFEVKAVLQEDFVKFCFVRTLNEKVAAIFEVFAQLVQHSNHFLSFGGSLPLCEYIVAHLRDFVKRFLKKSFRFFYSARE